jgi:hypothetical protein
MERFNSVDELINTIKPIDPVYCIRPNSIKSACSWFKNNFLERYFLRSQNKSKREIIKYIGETGIKRFNVSSINEIKFKKKK